MNSQSIINGIQSLSSESRKQLDELLAEDRIGWLEYVTELAELHEAPVFNKDQFMMQFDGTISNIKAVGLRAGFKVVS